MDTKEAKFRFVKYHILKSNINIKDVSLIDKKICIELNSSISNSTAEKHNVILALQLHDKNQKISIDIEMEGLFEFDKELSDEHKDKFYKINAPAILFPYLRAYVSTVTALSGISPITLPTFNFAAFKQ